MQMEEEHFACGMPSASEQHQSIVGERGSRSPNPLVQMQTVANESLQVPTADAFLARKRAFNTARSDQTDMVGQAAKNRAIIEVPTADAFLARKRAFNKDRSEQTAKVAQEAKTEASMEIPAADVFLARKRSFNNARSEQTAKVAQATEAEAVKAEAVEVEAEATSAAADKGATYGDWVNGKLEDEDSGDSDFEPDAKELQEEACAPATANVPVTRAKEKSEWERCSAIAKVCSAADKTLDTQAVLDKIEQTLAPAQQMLLAAQRTQHVTVTPQLKPAGRSVLSPWLLPQDNIPWGDSDNSFCDESFSKDHSPNNKLEAEMEVPAADAFLVRKRSFNNARSEQTAKVAQAAKTEASSAAVDKGATYGDWVNGKLEDEDAEDSDFEPDAEELQEEACAPATANVPVTRAKRVCGACTNTYAGTVKGTNQSTKKVECHVDKQGESENYASKMNKQSSTRSRAVKKTARKHGGRSNSRQNSENRNSNSNSNKIETAAKKNSSNSENRNSNSSKTETATKKNSGNSQRRRRGKPNKTGINDRSKGQNAGRRAAKGPALAERSA
jgi:hypothetical protein